MLSRVVAHEWRLLRADRVLWLVAALLVVLVGYAYRNGAVWQQTQSQLVGTALEEDSVRVATLGTMLRDLEAGRMEPPPAFRNPAQPAAVGRSFGVRAAVLPPAPLAATAVGQGDLFPASVVVSTATGDPMRTTPSIENPLHLLAGRFDLAFVAVFLLPLIVLAGSYSMLSREREDGTLALLLTQPVSVATLVAGKLLSRFLLIMGVFTVATIAAMLLHGVRPDATWGRAFGLWVAVVSAYTLFWLLLAAFAQLRGRSSGENAMALATVWLLLTIVVPAALNVTATLRFPVPSRAEMIGVEREASAAAQEEGAALLAAFYQDHPELAPDSAAATTVSFAAQSWAVQEEVNRVVAPVRARYESQAEQQRATLRQFRFLSPALLLQEALQDIAGTGDLRYRSFADDVARHQASFREFIGAMVVRDAPFTSANVSELPAFVASDPAALRAVTRRRVLGNLAGVLLLAAALMALIASRLPRAREYARA